MSERKETIVTARLPKAAIVALDALADATDRSRSWHIQQAVARYLAQAAMNEEYLAAAIRRVAEEGDDG